MPSVEMLRMTSSGTEASMSAIRLARAATGREKVVKFAGAYHGHVDGLLAEAGSGLATQGIPASPGVPAAATAATVIVPWNDSDAVRAAVAAAPARRRSSPSPTRRTWASSRRRAASSSCCASCADESGALLVFDEVITGFRVAPGGAQELTGVMPDLTVMGKVIGGGLPAAAYGGPAELLNRIAPAGDVYQAGTLSGNPLAVAAGLAALADLDEDAYLAARRDDSRARRRAARGRRQPPRPGRRHDRAADRLLLGRAGDRLRGRRRLRHRGARRLVPRAAGPRRLPAAVAVRGVVPVPRPHARARRAHASRRPPPPSRRST